MRTRTILSFLVSMFLILSIILAGCSDEKQQNGNAGSGSGEKKELTFWIYGWEMESANLIKEDAKKWSDSHPGVKIKVVPQTGDAMSQKLPAVVAGGNNPDISFIDAGINSMKLAAYGKLLSLDEYGADELHDRFYPAVWDSMMWDGKQYGLRITSNNLGLFYNKELFDKAGIKYPDANWTWDDFAIAAKKLTKGNGVYGLEIPVFSKLGEWKTWIWMSFLWQNGGEFLNQERTKAVFNSPEGIEAAEFWNTLVNEQKVAPKEPAGQGVDRFLTGKAAMTINGPWSIRPWYNDPKMKGKIGVAPLPKRKIAATNIGGEGIVIFKNTKYPKEAYEYVKHLTTDAEFLKKFYIAWPTVPPLKEYAEFYKDDAVYAEPMKVFNEQMADGKIRQFVPTWGEITDALDRELSEIIYNKKDPKKAMDDAAKETDKLLKESNK